MPTTVNLPNVLATPVIGSRRWPPKTVSGAASQAALRSPVVSTNEYGCCAWADVADIVATVPQIRASDGNVAAVLVPAKIVS